MAATPSLRTRFGLHFALLILTVLSQPTIADYQSGLDAYETGYYTLAMQEWKAVIASPPGEVPPATYAETHYAIGMLYWMGQGATTDYLEASRWLHKAGKLGHAGAQGKLGYLYAEGVTVQQNYELAFEWFSKAAKQGDIDGQYNLGIFYLNGWGTEQNKTMAAQYLAAASAQGDESAEVELQKLLPVLAQEKEKWPPEQVRGEEKWILTQNPNHYTIQVIGLSTKSGLEKLIHGYDHLAPFATYTLQRNNKPLHLLIQGVYPDVYTAREVSANFPVAIQKPGELWIRKFGRIQALIREEDCCFYQNIQPGVTDHGY